MIHAIGAVALSIVLNFALGSLFLRLGWNPVYSLIISVPVSFLIGWSAPSLAARR